MNYDKLFGFLVGLYKISTNTLDLLQKSFLVTLLIVTITFFMSNFLTFGIEGSELNYTYYISLGLIALAFLATIPFQMASIRAALDNKREILLPQLISTSAITEYMVIFGAIMGIAALALLPYATAYLMVYYDMENIKSTSNILLAIRMGMLVAGLIALAYGASKLIGALIYQQNGNNLSLSEVFKKSQGHFIAIMIVTAAMVVPIELITQFIIHNLAGLKNLANSYILDLFVLFIQTFVRSIALLLQTYYLMSGLTAYMKNSKLI